MQRLRACDRHMSADDKKSNNYNNPEKRRGLISQTIISRLAHKITPATTSCTSTRGLPPSMSRARPESRGLRVPSAERELRKEAASARAAAGGGAPPLRSVALLGVAACGADGGSRAAAPALNMEAAVIRRRNERFISCSVVWALGSKLKT